MMFERVQASFTVVPGSAIDQQFEAFAASGSFRDDLPPPIDVSGLPMEYLMHPKLRLERVETHSGRTGGRVARWTVYVPQGGVE